MIATANKDLLEKELKRLRKESRRLWLKRTIWEEENLKSHEINIKLTLVSIQKGNVKRESEQHKELTNQWLELYDQKKIISKRYEIKHEDFMLKHGEINQQISKMKRELLEV